MKSPRKREAWHPAAYDIQDIRAIQALAADPQHAKALDWIINKAAATYDEPFVPDSDAVRCYMLGRRSVGLAIVKLMKLKPDLFRKEGEIDV